MEQDSRGRGRWLALHVLPHESLIRAKLRNLHLYDIDVEDVIQEMYARLLTLPSLDTIRHPKQYAFLTARAIVVDRIRHARIISIVSTENLEELEVAAVEADSERRVMFKQEVVTVTTALNKLPKMCRDTLVLRRIEGLSQKEVARRLGISEKTVEKHMANGIHMLIETFGRGGKSKANLLSTRKPMFPKNVVDKPRD